MAIDLFAPLDEQQTAPENPLLAPLNPYVPEDRTPTSFIGKIFDILSRPNYASAKFFDTLSTDGLGAMGDAILGAGNEFFSPKERLSFSDLIRKHRPDFAQNHPYATTGLGLIGDVVLDPTTYLTFGTNAAALKIGTGAQKFVLGKKGVVRLAEEFTKALDEVGDVSKAFGGIGKAGEEYTKQALAKGISSELVGSAATYMEKLSEAIKTGNVTPDIAEGASKLINGQEGWLTKLHDAFFPAIPKPAFNEREVADWFREFAQVNTKRWIDPAGKAVDVTPQTIMEAAAENQKLLNAGEFGAQELARNSANRRMIDLITAGEQDLIDKGGIKFAGKSLVPGEKIGKFADAVGITRIKHAIEGTKQFETLGKLLSRDFRLPEEWVQMRKGYEAETGRLADDVMKAHEHWMELPEDARRKIGNMAGEIDDATSAAFRQAKSMNLQLTDSEAMAIRDQIVANTPLTETERAAYARLQQTMADIAQAEKEAGLLNATVHNYFPRMYEDTKDVGKFMLYRKRGMGGFLGSSEERLFQSLDAAKEAGFSPETDAMLVSALRMFHSRRAIAKANFKESALKLFGDGKTLESLSPRLKEDLAFIGDGDFPAGLNNGIRDVIQLYDRANGVFRKFATVARPFFAVKQGISNTIQSFAVAGLKAFKMFDPRAAQEAAGLLLHNKGMFHEGSDVAKKLLEYKMAAATGEHYTGAEILELAKRHGVLQGSNISGDALKEDIGKRLRDAQFLGKLPQGMEGLGKFVQGFSRYFNFPGHMEDWSRLSLFMQGLRMGHAPREAAAITEKALFNYRHGLSQFQRQIGRRIFPFISYQTFAAPLVAELIGKTPGRAAGLDKTARAFFDVWNRIESGDRLTEDERKVLPNFLLEQPHVFAKFGPKAEAIFRTFNSFSPIDMMGLIETDHNGDIDMHRSAIKAGLAQLSPYLKMPLELLMDKNFFTDQAISREKNPKAGKIGNVSPEGVLANMAAVLTAGSGGALAGIPGLLAGKVGGTALTSINPAKDILKELLGWEETEVTDSKGEKKRVAYINPYMAWAMTSVIPALSTAIRMDNPEWTPHERVLNLLTGVGTQKLDLRQSAAIQNFQRGKEIQDLRDRIRKAILYRRMDEADKARQELTQLMMDIAEERASFNLSNVRGQK